MVKKKKRKKKNRIDSIQDLQVEKEKLSVAIEYSEKAIKKDWEEIKDKMKPKGLGRWINTGLPLVGQALPVGKLAIMLIPNLFRSWGKSGDKEKYQKDEDASEATGEDKQATGWKKRFKKGFFKILAPFLAGTIASGAVFFRKKQR